MALSSLRIKFILITLSCLVLYNEWIAFYIKMKLWPVFPSLPDAHSVRMLLVADPQILSVQAEPNFPFSYIAVWDANRFVSRTYQMSLQFSQPDIVVFLGDLINDGSKSNSEEFVELVNSFHELLPTSSVKQTFYIAGDNDIGGEGGDPVTLRKIQRFYSLFKSENPLTCKFTQLYHLNIIPGVKDKLPGMEMEFESKTFDNETFRIVFSHYPLIAGAALHVQENINKIKPSILFSAHDHESYRLVGKKGDPKANQFVIFRNEGDVLEVNLTNEELHEISIPTCSYRMGKASYGFGFVEVTKEGQLRYAVLWLPSRFRQLWRYFWGLVICISLLIYPFLLHISIRFSKSRVESSSFDLKSHNV